MTPIQLWLPTFFGGIARPELRRDMQRMFRARKEEHAIWSVPDWTEPSRWQEGRYVVSGLNGDVPECARILHVGENGHVAGAAAQLFSGKSIAGWLDAWLNDDFIRFVPADPAEPLRVKVPDQVNGTIEYGDAELTITGESFLPFALARDERVYAQWPPRTDMPTTVSPEMESARRSGDQTKSRPMRFIWLAPFDVLQPLRISPDDMFAHAKMRQIAEDSRDDNAQALALATTEAREWLSEGEASTFECWLKPIVAAEGEPGALVAIYSRYGIEAHSFEQVYKDEKLRESLTVRVPVTRAWGVPGLMWTLLLEQLSGAQPYRTCDSCGRLIAGRGHKRFCSAEENLECYQARRAKDQRRSRARRPTSR